MKIEAYTVGELIAQLQKLDPEMKLGERGGAGMIDSGLTLEQERVMVLKDQPSTAALVSDKVWAKRRNDFKDDEIDILVCWG